uniref:Uncharacterized protein n=1 Tax=Nelumbo nucifera TaxID=4432 RepID=A0A822Z4B1_NELNU|nr:TPA_asm: hypothetical protein HUJ06_013980 [Nelumbo nucifera]
MEESISCQWSMFRALLSIVQWWGFNVTVIIMNKWIFQVSIRVLLLPKFVPFSILLNGHAFYFSKFYGYVLSFRLITKFWIFDDFDC